MPDELVGTLRDIAGFRNIVVHGYQEVDPAVLIDIAENRLDDLLSFCRAVRERMDRAT